MSDQKSTEDIIFEAARAIFKRKGKAGTRMQEIADEAGINKSMLHYYFRSKDKLFQEVYQREMARFLPTILKVVKAETTIEEKIKRIVETYHAFFKENPELPHFVVMEMNQNPKRFIQFISKQNIDLDSALKQQIIETAKKGEMDSVPVDQFIVSEVALVLFPFIASPMIKGLFGYDDEQFNKFLEERKSFLVEFILNGINYKK